MPKPKVKKHVKRVLKDKKKRRVLFISITIIMSIAVIGLLVAINQGVISMDEIKDYLFQLINPHETPIDDPIEPKETLIWSENVLLIGDELSGAILEVHFIDVGQGDSIFIEFPDGKVMLIDGGDTPNAVRDAILNYLEMLEIETIDYMLLTHTHADHLGALDDVLIEYPVKSIYMPNLTSSYGMPNASSIPQSISTKAYNSFYELAIIETYMDGDIEVSASIIFNEDILIIAGEDYTFTMFCPPAEYYENITPNSSGAVINNMSPICVLEYGGRFLVFTGDGELTAENRFIEQMGDSIDMDVLKVGHHGSETSSNEAFLEFISVEYAVILTDGKSHNHPRQVAIDRLLESGVEYIFRSDLHSDINLSIDSEGNMRFQVVNYVEYENTIVGH